MPLTRPSMRFVPVKSAQQQSALMLHRTRDLLIGQRTQLINALRAHLAELGLAAPQGREGVHRLMVLVTQESGRVCRGWRVLLARPSPCSSKRYKARLMRWNVVFVSSIARTKQADGLRRSPALGALAPRLLPRQ